MENNIVQKSMSWSFFAEVAVKFVVPITNMILARLLTPDAFGVVAVCNMLISLVDLISDAGFGKYLVQHDFDSDEEKSQCTNVAFLTNLGISVIIVLLVTGFRFPVAKLLGNREYGNVISIASLQLIFTSMSSIQMSLLRRNFEFKKLFVARISVAIARLLCAVSLSVMLRTFWGLIIGNLVGELVNAIILTYLAQWRPKLYYNSSLLKKMFSYSFWSLCEALANWAIFWIDIFIVGNHFSEYQLGLYKNSANMVQSIMGMISASMGPVLLSTLSRLKKSSKKYNDVFLNIQTLILYLVLPMGIGLYLYKETITVLLFGDQWVQAANIVGAWSLMMLCSIAFYSLPAELYKSKGIPQILFLFQVLYLVVLIPVCAIAAQYGFWVMVYARCLCVLWQIVISIVFTKTFFHISIVQYFKTFIWPTIITSCMVLSSKVWGIFLHGKGELISIFLCMLVYLGLLRILAKKQIARSVYLLKKEKLS